MGFVDRGTGGKGILLSVLGQEGEPRWAGTAACEVTASAHQVYGALGFALESGLHVYYRRARAVQAWAVAACDALRSP